jgi:hypothetical protein
MARIQNDSMRCERLNPDFKKPQSHTGCSMIEPPRIADEWIGGVWATEAARNKPN